MTTQNSALSHSVVCREGFDVLSFSHMWVMIVLDLQENPAQDSSELGSSRKLLDPAYNNVMVSPMLQRVLWQPSPPDQGERGPNVIDS